VVCIVEAGLLAVLVGDISKVMVDLGVPPIPMIPHDPGRGSDILEAMGTILEWLREAHASSHGPWD
jgi:hypothetical protein